MIGKWKVFKCTCIYCAPPVAGRHNATASKNENTHDVKASLSLRWTHIVFVLLMHSCSI